MKRTPVEKSSGEPVCVVLAIPDVGRVVNLDSTNDKPEVVSRVSKSRFQHGAQTMVFVGWLLAYALIGVLAANAVVWCFGKSKSTAVVATTQATNDKELRTSKRKIELVENRKWVPKGPVRDPAVSENLRVFLDEIPARKDRRIEQVSGDQRPSVAELPAPTRNRY